MEQTTRNALDALAQTPTDPAAFEAAEDALIAERLWRDLATLFGDYAETFSGHFRKYWQRLIERLEGLAGGYPPEDASELFVTVGQIWEQRLQRSDQAMMAYQRAFKVNPLNGRALDLARDIYARDNNFAMVEKLWKLQLKVVTDPVRQAPMMVGLAEVLYHHLDGKDTAIRLAQGALEIQPDLTDARRLLDLMQGRVSQEVSTLEMLTHDLDGKRGAERAQAQLRLATFILEAQPEDAPDPDELIEQAHDLAPDNLEIREAFFDLLARKGDWGGLSQVLRTAIGAEVDRDRKLELLLRLANVELELDEAQATATLREVLSLDPLHPAALAQASRFYERSGEWTELIGVYEVAIKAAGRGEQSAHLLAKTAEVYWLQLGDMAAAEKHFKKLRLMDARNETMLRFYVARYREAENHTRLLSTLQSLRDVTEDDEARLGYALEMAEVAEHQLKKTSKTIDVWKWILRNYPDHVQARVELHRLYTAGRKWNALLDLLKADVDAMSDDQVDEKVEAYREMIAIYRDHLRLDVMVINTYTALLQVKPDDLDALDALAERYAAAPRWNDYVGILEQRVRAVESPDEKLAILRQIAETWRDKLGNHARAVDPLERVLELAPEDQDAIDQLKAIYTSRRDYKSLVQVQQKEIPLLAPEERVGALREMATVARRRLKDQSLLARVYTQLLDVTDGADNEAASELIALYDQTDQWTELAGVLQRLHDGGHADHEQVLRLADLYATHLTDLERAVDIWRSVLEQTPEDYEARVRLTQAFTTMRDWDALEALAGADGDRLATLDLFEISAQQTDDTDEAVALYERVARICEADGLAEREIAALESIRALRPDDPAYADQLAERYRREQRHNDLAMLLQQRLGGVEAADAAPFRLELAELCAGPLDAPEVAYGHYVEHYTLNPADVDVRTRIAALADRIGTLEDWFETLKTISAQMPRGDERVDNYRTLGRLAAGPVARPTAAIDFFERVRGVLPQDPEALQALAELYAQTDQHAQLVEILEETKAIVESDEVASLAMRQAELLSLYLGKPEEALNALNEVLEHDPESLPALRGLRRTYAAVGQWNEVVETCQTELALLQGEGRAEVLHTLATTLNRELLDVRNALPHYQELLGLEGAGELRAEGLGDLIAMLSRDDVRLEVADMVEPVLRDAKRWDDVVTVLEARIAAGQEPLARFKALAEVYDQGMEDNEAAYFTLGRALLEVVPDQDVWAEMLRLATELELHGDLATRWVAAAEYHTPRVLDPLLPALATLQEDTVEDLEGARTTLGWILDAHPEEQNALDQLERVLAGLEDLDALANLLVSRAEDGSIDLRAARLREAAQLREREERHDDAIGLLREVLSFDPDNVVVYEDLEGLYTANERWEDLSDHYLQWIDIAEEALKPRLHVRRGRLAETHLEDVDLAIAAYSAALELAPGDTEAEEALRALAAEGATPEARQSALNAAISLFMAQEAWETMVAWVPLRLQEADGDDARVGVLAATAQLLENELERPEDAFEHLRQALSISASRPGVRASAEALAAQLDRWGDIVGLYEVGLDALDDEEARFALSTRLGEIYRDELADVIEAIGHFTTATQLQPEAIAPLAALDELYAAAGRHDDRVTVLLRRAELVDEAEGGALRKEAARVVNGALADPDRAISVWEGIRRDMPGDEDTLEALTNLYVRQSRWSDAVDALQDHIGVTEAPEARVERQLRLASLQEERLEDLDAAIHTWESLRADGQAGALEALDRLYGLTEQFDDQAEVISAALDVQEEPALRLRLAHLYAGPLDRPTDALECATATIEEAATRDETLALLESLAERDETVDEALLLLEMAYDEASDWPALVRTLTARHEREEGAAAVALLDRIATLREQQLEDTVGAFVASLEAYKASGAALDRQQNVERLAAATESWGAYVMACEELAQHVVSPDRQREMHLRAAQVYADNLHDDDEAATHYRAMVAADATDLEALRPLDAYYTAEEDWAELIEILDLEAAALTEVEERVAILHRLATVQAEALEETEDAQETLRRVWSLDPANREAFDRLIALHTAAEDWDGVGGVIAHYRAHVEGAEATRLDFQLAELERTELDHPDKALDGYEAVLAADPAYDGLDDALWAVFVGDAEGAVGIRAAVALEPMLRTREDRDRLLPVLQARAEWSETTDRAARYDELVQLHLDDDNHGAAFHMLTARLALDAASPEGWARLIEVAPYVGDWDTTVEALEAGAVETEPPLRFELTVYLAQVLAERLEELERAQFVLETLLEEDPSPSDAALTLLERVLHQAKAWDDLATFYRRRAEATEGTEEKAALLEKVARIQENFVLDPSAAVVGYRALLEVRPDDVRAIQSVERILVEQEEWTELADFWAQTASTIEGAERARMLTRLGELYLQELDEPAMSLGVLRQALEEVPRYAAAMAALEGILADARQQDGGGMLGAEVATLLEPLYQADVEWLKLVEVYEVQRAATDDPREAVVLLSKLASIYEAHDDAAQAFATWARALRVAPDDAQVADRLTQLTEASGEWDQLRALLLAIVEDADSAVANGLRMRVAAIHERTEDDAAIERAIDVYREILTEEETHMGASEALERLLASRARWEELAAVLDERLHVVDDDAVRRALHLQIAELQESRLDNAEAAAETYRHLLGDDPDNTDALDALERLYADTGLWDDYIGILAHKVELVDSDEERRMLYAQIGETQANQLENPFEAIEAFRMVRESDPDDVGAIYRLIELYESAEEWTEQVEMLLEMRDRTEASARVDAIVQIGRVRWRRLEDASGAISALADAVSADPENDDAVELLEEMMADDGAALMAAEVLEPLYREQGNDEALLELLDRRASTTDSQDVRFDLFIEMAQIAEQRLEDPDRAFEWFGHALMTKPSSAEALDALMRIGRATERLWSAVDMIDTVLHECYDTDNIVKLGLLAAKTRWKELDDLDGARDGYFGVLEHSGEQSEALVALEEILEELGDAEGLADVLGRRIANQDGDMPVLQCRLAGVYEDDLDNPEQALALYRDVLLDRPDHEPAIAGLLRLVPVPDTSEDAAEAVLPILRSSERWQDLIEVLQSRLGELHDEERIAALHEIAATYERLDDAVSALPFYVSAFEEDPNDTQRFAPVLRLAEALDQPHVIANAAFNVVDTVAEPTVAERVFTAGASAAEQEDDVQRQEVLLRALVEVSPEFTEGLDGLEMLYRRKGDAEALLEILGRKADLIYDIEEKVTLYLQMAQTAELELNDLGRAQEYLDEVLAIDSRHTVAYDELIRLAESQDDWATALEVLERKAETLYGAEVVPVRMRIAEIAVIHLDAPDTAIDAYREVLVIEPTHQEALYALSTVYREQEAWDDLHQVLRQQLDSADDDSSRASLLTELSSLAEQELYDADGAIEYQRRLVAIEPSSTGRARLESLLRDAERWSEVLMVLQDRLDAGDLSGLDARVEMANIAVEELHDLVRAEEHLNAVLKEDPHHAHALGVLSRLYQEQGRWDEARAILEERLAATEPADERVPLLGALASLMEGELNDVDGAIERYEEAASLDPTHTATLDALERIYTRTEAWPALLSTLHRRVRLEESEQKIERFLQIAALAQDRLGDETARLAALENAYSLDHENTTVAEQLLEAYIAAKRTQEARPILANLIAGLERSGRAAQRELYRYLHQKGDLAAAAGELDAALDAYTQAQKQNPSYVPNLVSLGRLHYSAERWDDALQVYQAALLNQLSIRDPDMKVDVFYHLGELRLRAGDTRRARDMFSRALRTKSDHQPSEAGLKACDAAEGK